MKKFQVRHNPFEFRGKTYYNIGELEARDCHEALFKFMSTSPENFDAEITGVKPSGALRWRTDPGLLSKGGILRAAIRRGYIAPPPAEYVSGNQ